MDTSNLDVKLKRAIAYLDDRLTTHRASRFRPSHVSILDRWLAQRRSAGAMPIVELAVAGSATAQTILTPVVGQ